MLKHLNTSPCGHDRDRSCFLGLVYPLAMTAIAQVALPEAGQWLARHRERQSCRIVDHRPVVDEAAVLSRASVGCR